ncbi:MAG TPA: hypothetical protein VHK45_11690, partial [Geminicoccaceae bacterium]|nr:hypothetical protein [Geminicoccaceae bacterium]
AAGCTSSTHSAAPITPVAFAIRSILFFSVVDLDAGTTAGERQPAPNPAEPESKLRAKTGRRHGQRRHSFPCLHERQVRPG